MECLVRSPDPAVPRWRCGGGVSLATIDQRDLSISPLATPPATRELQLFLLPLRHPPPCAANSPPIPRAAPRREQRCQCTDSSNFVRRILRSITETVRALPRAFRNRRVMNQNLYHSILNSPAASSRNRSSSTPRTTQHGARICIHSSSSSRLPLGRLL